MELSAAETFSKEEISAVKEGYQQYQDGKIVTHAEAISLFDEWLKE
jgi:predicted transcriptional regulator